MVPRPGAIVGGRFRLERLLATGAMGAVWQAHHLELDTAVAVKFMAAGGGGSAAARARFEREAKAAAQLQSPHVVKILAYGVDEDTPYLAMELLTGEDLRARLEREGRLSLPALSVIVGQLAKALKLAHEAGIVHRDLKPSNVFLARSGDDEIVKVLDFGVAKAQGAAAGATESTATGLLLGSPAYMSPEQARGGALDHRSDLWSVGVICYVALTGRRPFAGDHVGDVLVKICTAEVPPATTVVPAVGPAIDRFFERALCKSPDGRFGSAREMADELAGAPFDADVSAVPVVRDATEAVPRSEATLSLAPASSPLATESVEPRAALGDAAVAGSGSGSPRSHWRWLVAGGAAAAVALVVLAVRLGGGSAAPSPAATALPSAAAAVGPAATELPAVAPDGAAAAATAPPPASAASSSSPPARTARGAARPARSVATSRSSAAPPAVDPKFGLPVNPSP
jgi:serine/threonine-protein kinase